jgi:hypothetical protein
VDQVGEGFSRAHALVDQALGFAFFLNGQHAIRRSREFLVGDPQRVREQPRRLVSCVMRAVPEAQARRPQPALGGREPLAQSAMAGALQDARSRASRRR